MKVLLSSPVTHDNIRHEAGEVIDIPEAAAELLLRRGLAAKAPTKEPRPKQAAKPDQAKGEPT